MTAWGELFANDDFEPTDHNAHNEVLHANPVPATGTVTGDPTRSKIPCHSTATSVHRDVRAQGMENKLTVTWTNAMPPKRWSFRQSKAANVRRQRQAGPLPSSQLGWLLNGDT